MQNPEVRPVVRHQKIRYFQTSGSSISHQLLRVRTVIGGELRGEEEVGREAGFTQAICHGLKTSLKPPSAKTQMYICQEASREEAICGWAR